VKPVVIIAISVVVIFGTLMLVTDMMPNIPLEPKNIDEENELKIKAERLQKAHNDIVSFNKIHTPDPKDYGFDLDIGFTNNEQKDEWCGIVLENNKEMNTLILELDQSLKQLENESNQSLQLQEYVVEDRELLQRMIEHEKISDKMIDDFACKIIELDDDSEYQKSADYYASIGSYNWKNQMYAELEEQKVIQDCTYIHDKIKEIESVESNVLVGSDIHDEINHVKQAWITAEQWICN